MVEAAERRRRIENGESLAERWSGRTPELRSTECRELRHRDAIQRDGVMCVSSLNRGAHASHACPLDLRRSQQELNHIGYMRRVACLRAAISSAGESCGALGWERARRITRAVRTS